jgi:uncharacterized protein YcfJ
MFALKFTASSSVLIPATLAIAVLLTACGNQASAPTAPASASNDPPAQQAPAAQQPASMSVAELTGNPTSNTTPAPANPTTSLDPSASAATSAPASPPTTGTLASTAYAPHDAPNSPPPASTQIASAQPLDGGQFAQVVSVQALRQPQRVCTDQTVTERRRPEDRHQVAGTVIGAIAGGVIGHQIGGGRGRGLATVGGAVGGGIVGKKIQEDHQNNDTVTRVVQRCHTVTPGKDVAALYEVVYAYQGQNFHVKLDHDPGERVALPVRGIE